MPLLVVPAVLLGLVLLWLVLLPLGLLLRYRSGTRQRVLRAWEVKLALATLLFATALALAMALLMQLWWSHVFAATCAGLAGGLALAIAGLRLTRFDRIDYTVRYRPHAGIALLLTLLVAARIAWGAWRLQGGAAPDDGDGALALLTAAPTALLAGLLLGYHLGYQWGLLRRLPRRLERL
ncbi:hypothetical protein [Coralloluteibacterium thermophilus]|uniref:DUF1453 domain-containing protein n=1 Tax=Coralloluteibacterium thermophilum TaxID=2707049 RepID=A0ABV9NLK6_9GAMM